MSRLPGPIAAVALLALATACAPAASTSGVVRVTRTATSAAYPEIGGAPGSGDVPSSAASFAAPPAAAWTALVQVYESLGIRTTAIDNQHMVIASIEQRTRSVGGKRVIEYVDCGGTYGSQNSYDVFLTIRTQLQPAPGGGTAAGTQVIGTARPPLSNSRLQCSSNGSLELLVAAKLRETLGTAAGGK